MQVFPSRKSLIRMMGAVFAEMDEEWAGRRWFNDDSIGRAVEDAKVNALIVADNPVPGGKAA